MKKIYDIVDEYKQLILDAERWIWANPEPGYKEFKTHKYMADAFIKMGYDLTYADGITGFYTTVDTGREGPTVLVLAELDSLINFNHPECDKQTGAIHNCGHHGQCAIMLGVAAALKREEVLEGLSGKIKLCVVPAEEGIEVGYRKELVKKGVIKFTSGKPEFISRRFFDDVDIAFMTHLSTEEDKSKKFILTKGHNGVIRKHTRITGKSSHAGARPHEGINALNAANLALLSINSLRETFVEKDYVRVHSIITKGGDAVNAVPDEVTIESYVRASNSIAMKNATQAVNRAISASCAAIGAKAHIEDLAGSEPLHEDANLREVALKVFEDIVGKDGYVYNDTWAASSTDMGDLSTLVPSIHMYTNGAIGSSHGINYYVEDPYNACVNGAKAEVGLLCELLKNGAEKAKEIIAKFKPVFNSVDEYLAHKNSLNMDKDNVIYNQDGTITLDYKN
ncbi:MAG: amidohydrolase [Clostridia bacterium]|nr:amidohydrolase [Clostridia bacterium]